MKLSIYATGQLVKWKTFYGRVLLLNLTVYLDDIVSIYYLTLRALKVKNLKSSSYLSKIYVTEGSALKFEDLVYSH